MDNNTNTNSERVADCGATPCSASSFDVGQEVIVEKSAPYPWRKSGVVKSAIGSSVTVKVPTVVGDKSMFIRLQDGEAFIGGSKLTLTEL